MSSEEKSTDNKDVLFYTSTVSDHMGGEHSTSFQGLYMCSLDKQSGLCEDPKLVGDRFDHDGEKHRGIRLTNVAMDDSQSHVYSVYFENDNRGFEILRAPLTTAPVSFDSFFHTKGAYTNSQCDLRCCPDASHTYMNLLPRSFSLDGDDIYVSWGGLYQDCADEFLNKANFNWSIGISKINKGKQGCVFTGEKVDFDDCTTPVAIAFQTNIGSKEDVLLGYSSFQSGLSPSGKRIFFLSILRDPRDSGEKVVNEIWAFPEGESYTKNPNALQVVSSVEVARQFVHEGVDDVGSIRLHKNKDGVVSGLCTTAYDAGIFCYEFHIDEESKLRMLEQKTFVTKEKVEESCRVEASVYHPQTIWLPPVASGLEVVWENSTFPDMILFGCLGEVADQGNFLTAFRDGSIKQTMDGGFPGSIFFGTDLTEIPSKIEEHFQPPADWMPERGIHGELLKEKKSNPFPLIVTIVAALSVASFVARKILQRRRQDHMFRQLLQRRYDPVFQEDTIDFGRTLAVPSETSYMEMPSTV